METALVLGGGGVAGIAWEAGVVLGLQQAGVDVAGADLVIGTSAGAIIGTHVAAGSDLRTFGTPPRLTEDAPPIDLDAMINAYVRLFDPNIDPVRARCEVGEMACAAPVGEEAPHIARISALLSGTRWPERPFLVSAVEVRTGALVTWDRQDGVLLGPAVAASCSVPCVYPPVTIEGRRYMDGGTRSGTNADLARGASAVVILDPMAHLAPREPLRAELVALGTPEVHVVEPDPADAVGLDMPDAAQWMAALRAGLAQAPGAADAVRAVWPS